jgi:hypothetical protein
MQAAIPQIIKKTGELKTSIPPEKTHKLKKNHNKTNRSP